MANPRKFSEKIALHNQKQAAETAAFEAIMREVSDATAKPEEPKPLPVQRESRGRSVGGGPIRSRPIERKMDTSPYASGPYLSPPPDTSWRRTNSDSALHHSATAALQQQLSNENLQRGDSIRWISPQRPTSTPSQHYQYEQRPRSSCDVPRVPGINIYQAAHEPGTIQIPIGNNTGSLPDLTNVHFQHNNNSLDQDQSSSPYSSSPVSASPATLSPTSLPTRQPSARFQFSPMANRATSPVSPHQNHLSVPSPGNSRFLNCAKGMPLNNSLQNLIEPTQQTDYSQYQINNYQQQCSPPSPTSSANRINAQMGSNNTYRSPRSSPQSSPAASGGGEIARNCIEGRSAPCSPQSATPDAYLYNQTTLLQHFEACTMLDNPVTNNYNIDTTNTNSQFSQANSDLSNIELGNDAGYFSTSPSGLQYPTAPTSLHTTPNTPTSIPDIILTDFSATSGTTNATNVELSKELSSAISDFFPSDESLREGLVPIDFDGFQMLTDPELNVISDYAEDHFRQDRS